MNGTGANWQNSLASHNSGLERKILNRILAFENKRLPALSITSMFGTVRLGGLD